MRLIATCPEETKSVLIRELERLGAKDIKPLYRAVDCEVEPEQFYEAHLRLRTASRILQVIKDIPAKSPEMLYSQARRIPWHELFAPERTFIVEGVPADRGAEAMRSNDISKKVREALQDVFARNAGRVPKVDLQEPKVVIVAFLQKGRCLLSFDTAGKALHKRGYRESGHPAPIKETLAAALLDMIGYDGSQPFLDPMCGSGTIAIEAAMIALDKPPQIHRPKGQFLFEWLKDFDRDLWRHTQERLRQERREAPAQPIIARDISSKYVAMARRNALKARVEKHLTFDCGPFQDLEAPTPTGILVSNLPYGERLARSADEELKELYQAIGNTLKRNFSGWRAGLLVAEDAPHKFIGLKPQKRIPVLNGSIACKFLIFDLYAGTRRRASVPAPEED